MDRYQSRENARGGANPRAPRAIVSLLAPLVQRDPNVTVRDICSAAGISPAEISTAEGFRGARHQEDRVCLHFLCGGCKYNGCMHAHLYESELPRGYAKTVEKALEPGVKRLLSGEQGPRDAYGPRQKRQRNGDGGRYGGRDGGNGGGWRR